MPGYNISVEDASWSKSWRHHNQHGNAIRRHGRCFYCGVPLQNKNANAPDAKTRDHIVPKSKGGRGISNFVNACRWCNSFKGNKSVVEFRKAFNERRGEPYEAKFYGEIQRGVSIAFLYALGTGTEINH